MEQYVRSPSKTNLAIPFLHFASYCKLVNSGEARDSYVKALRVLAEQASKHRNICNTLVAGIEQADEKLLTMSEFGNVIDYLTESLSSFYYREMPDGATIWTVVWRLDKPVIFQIRCSSERHTERRLSLILMLTVLANREILCESIKELSGFKEDSITFMMFDQEGFEENILKLPDDVLRAEYPSVITRSNIPFSEEQPPIGIVIHRSYATLADWSIYPENKAVIWLLMNFYESIIEHIAHKRRDRTLARKAREFCEEVFENNELYVGPSTNGQLLPRIEDIELILEKIQRFGKATQVRDVLKRQEGNDMVSILFLAANPRDTRQLRLAEEIRSIDQILRQTEFRDKFAIQSHWAVRVTDLQGLLMRHKPDIVHFSGHGSSSSEIVLEDKDGNSQPVSARALSQIFSILKDNIRCVVLNCCYSEQQAQAIAQHIDCVIGMSKAIGDEAAIGFAASFYQALGYGRNVRTAFDLGCAQLDLENLGEQDTPKLLAVGCNPEEVIFVCDN